MPECVGSANSVLFLGQIEKERLQANLAVPDSHGRTHHCSLASQAIFHGRKWAGQSEGEKFPHFAPPTSPVKNRLVREATITALY